MGKYVHAFGVGWIIYMVGMVMTAYEGTLSLIFQPFMAAITSCIFTLLALVVGQVFRIKNISDHWKDIRFIRYCFWIIGLVLLFYPVPFGHYTRMADPETGELVLTVPVGPLMMGYFLIIFTIAHWPTSQRLSDKNKYLL